MPRQGENNRGDPHGYACRFPAMIADWRHKFGLPSLPFLFVQLAAFDDSFVLLRAAQTAALALPATAMATAIDLGDPTSPAGNIHPRLKQEVGRRLGLGAMALAYGDSGAVIAGPAMRGVTLSDGTVTVAYEPASAVGLHLAGTAACVECCNVSALEVLSPRGGWLPAGKTSVSDGAVVADVSGIDGPIGGVRYAWVGYAQCAVYSGTGGYDSHEALPAPPFQHCFFGTVGGAPAWDADCIPTDPNVVHYNASGATVPTASADDFSFGGGASAARGPADARCDGANVRTGNPGQVGTIISHHALLGDGHVLDAISVGFRWAAGYTPDDGAPPKKASTVSLVVMDGNSYGGRVVKTVQESPPLGNYSYDRFNGYSPLLKLGGSGLALDNKDTKLYVALRVTNNERNLQIALDDKADGWAMHAKWD